ncbi:MAG: ribosome maturation protein RimP [Sphingomonadaceae bacterium]
MADIARLTEIIAPEVEAEGLELVRVRMTGGKAEPILQVMAEDPATRQLTLGDCERLSRRISARLDEEDPIDQSYRLEVSSPGIDRPLTRLKDFEDWKGHEARLSVIEPVLDRKRFSGTLLGVDRDLIGLKSDKLDEIWVTLENIHSARLILTDRLIAATKPLSPEGADRITLEGRK